jgi:hypothetical protein
MNLIAKTKLIFAQVQTDKENLQQAEIHADQKNLLASVKICEQILASWQKNVFWLEKWLQKIALGGFLQEVQTKLIKWREIINEAKEKESLAKNLLKIDQGNPWEIYTYSQALTLYQQSLLLVNNSECLTAVKICEQEILRREKYQKLVLLGQEKTTKYLYKDALILYNQAYRMYQTDKLKKMIINCKEKSKLEEIYNGKIEQVNEAITEGKIGIAIAMLENLLSTFPKTEGKELLAKLKTRKTGQELYLQGLQAEKAGNYQLAISKYIQLIKIFPEGANYRLRLSIVHIKMKNWPAAIASVMTINNRQASYIRGFAYAQQKNWYQAYQEWQHLGDATIQKQKEILKLLVNRDRIEAIKEIEILIDAGKIAEAKTASLTFIQKFKANDTIRNNLIEHINPRLEALEWRSFAWEKITENTEKIWLEKQDINSLHNWTISLYYYSQINPEKIGDLIFAWITDLANIHSNPNLEDIPWLGSTKVNLLELADHLRQLIEKTIDKIKETDVEKYFQMRDRYRLEITALNMMGNPPHSGMKINKLLITPGIYQKYYHKLNAAQMWQTTLLQNTLYTDWGLAVAACIEGDTARAMTIKPTTGIKSEIERYAYKFICYNEGCYYLQKQQWRPAVKPLREAQIEIKASEKWQEELNRLCSNQKQVIKNFDEHLEFAKFWYDLLASQPSKDYLAEFKAEEIREKLMGDKIDSHTAWIELKIIQEIDANNPVVNDLIERIEFAQEMQEIHQMLAKDEFREAVAKAKRSRNSQVKQKVAEICIDILIEGFKSRKLDFEQIEELGKWAYELCPEDEGIQEIYHFSQELAEIHKLMEKDRFDEALRKAKNSEHQHIRYYLAEFFISTLIKGLQSGQMPIELVHQLAGYAYELCPDEEQYQEIYETLGVKD